MQQSKRKILVCDKCKDVIELGSYAVTNINNGKLFHVQCTSLDQGTYKFFETIIR